LEKAKINRNKEILEGSFGMRAALGANQREWKQYIDSLMPRPEKAKVSSKVEYLQFRRLMSHG